MNDKGTNGRGPRSKRQATVYPFNDLEGTRWLLCLIVGASLSGGAVRVGLTRDGGALSLGIYKDSEYGSEYVRPDEDLATAVREISVGWDITLAIWDDDADCWRLPS